MSITVKSTTRKGDLKTMAEITVKEKKTCLSVLVANLAFPMPLEESVKDVQ